jgi:uncharacterized protein YprB with RNaseH-like and TPR domain
MLKNTFCHIPLISSRTEEMLWRSGVRSWGDVPGRAPLPLTEKKCENVKKHIEESVKHLEAGDTQYFSEEIPTNQHWRLFREFRSSAAFLDIETTGLWANDEITTIALYDGTSIYHYINGVNLNQFKKDILRYNLIVTYNGKCFDVPFIQNYFGIHVTAAHIDLRYVLKSLGYTGGLKRCEEKLGIRRDGLEDVDGFFAVLLWNEYKKKRNERALETLLAYNIKDAVDLEELMIRAYNMKLQDTPFRQSHRIALPFQPALPFEPDREIIDTLKSQFYLTF